MPVVLRYKGYKFFFYSNEGNEPIHIHAEKNGMECKYWLNVEEYEIAEAHAYNLTIQMKREIKKIIYDHFDYIVSEWNNYFKKGN